MKTYVFCNYHLLTSVANMSRCCSEALVSSDLMFVVDCLEVCENEQNCDGETRDAAVLLMRATKCISFAHIFKKCCKGID